jgi:hypothetical protein
MQKAHVDPHIASVIHRRPVTGIEAVSNAEIQPVDPQSIAGTTTMTPTTMRGILASSNA